VSSNSDDWIGLEIAEGRYKILGRIGQGTMGQVYLAHDRHLQTDIVLKFPFATDKTSSGPEFLDRFAREIRSLVQLSHPHIVKVFDVGEHDGRPFVAMQFLAGGSLKDRIACGPGGQARPMPPGSLSDWLLDVAKALDFIHAQKHIHRDVKPANILFDRHGHAFLGDFGIIKALTADEVDGRENSLTAPGFLVGTPNYVAPEIVMGRPFDGRVDQYSLAMTVHEVLSGANCMEGPTPSATVVNQTMVVPPGLSELVPTIPRRLSDAILRGLAKEPSERFESCASLAHEILAGIPATTNGDSAATLNTATSRGRPGQVPCPACEAPLPVGREHAGGRVRCTRCQALSSVSLLSSNTVQLKLLEPVPVSAAAPVRAIVEAPDGDEGEPDPSAATVLAAPIVAGKEPRPGNLTRRSAMKWAWVAAAIAGIGLSALLLATFVRGQRDSSRGGTEPPGESGIGDRVADHAAQPGSIAPALQNARVEINVAYGTEKQKWLEEATEAFQKTSAGKEIDVKLHGMGSLEGARAVSGGPAPVPIHVWSPASSAYRDTFEREWRTKHDHAPIIKSDNLALTPMVFVMWEARHAPFLKKFGKLSFRTVGEAMHESGGWQTIAQQPDWGRFKFGHTDPNLSNSGLLTLVLMGYEFNKKEHNLTQSDVVVGEFQRWFAEFERAVSRPGGSLTSSTGTLMREMVLRGPSQYDCLLIYENLAIDYLEAARDRWGELHVDYPEPNIWNEHPYYILDVPWSDTKQRAAAAEFLKFLMSEPIQKRALEHGFRPGNPSVSVRFAESPLLRYAKQGLKIDLPRMCEPPPESVIEDLLATFSRNHRK
jgi:serine/threonine-protein kinase